MSLRTDSRIWNGSYQKYYLEARCKTQAIGTDAHVTPCHIVQAVSHLHVGQNMVIHSVNDEKMGQVLLEQKDMEHLFKV